MIFLFLQCVSPVIIVYIIISLLNSYLYIHWILDFKVILVNIQMVLRVHSVYNANHIHMITHIVQPHF